MMLTNRVVQFCREKGEFNIRPSPGSLHQGLND